MGGGAEVRIVAVEWPRILRGLPAYPLPLFRPGHAVRVEDLRPGVGAGFREGLDGQLGLASREFRCLEIGLGDGRPKQGPEAGAVFQQIAQPEPLLNQGVAPAPALELGLALGKLAIPESNAAIGRDNGGRRGPALLDQPA
jgi:hypothetical protein